jgi:hypothetical protein
MLRVVAMPTSRIKAERQVACRSPSEPAMRSERRESSLPLVSSLYRPSKNLDGMHAFCLKSGRFPTYIGDSSASTHPDYSKVAGLRIRTPQALFEIAIKIFQ